MIEAISWLDLHRPNWSIQNPTDVKDVFDKFSMALGHYQQFDYSTMSSVLHCILDSSITVRKRIFKPETYQ